MLVVALLIGPALVRLAAAADTLTFLTATADNATDSAGLQAYADHIASLVPDVQISVDSTIGLETWSDTYWAEYAEIQKRGAVDVTNLQWWPPLPGTFGSN